MNKKGQALVEFILILPIIILIFVSLIDIGNIFLQKYSLNNDLDTITTLYQNNKEKEAKAYAAKENIIYEQTQNNDMTTITIQKTIQISAPGLSNVLGKQYIIKDSKTIYKNE